MIVNPDDSLREYYYGTDTMNRLYLENEWKEISMKRDFKVIFEK